MSVTVICGESGREMARMKAGSVDLVFTSPPYNIGKEYEERQEMDDYLAAIQPVIAGCARVLRPGGSLVWQVGYHVKDGELTPLDLVFIPRITKAGLSLRERIVWRFGFGHHATHRFSGRHEMILWFTKGRPDYDIEAMRAAGLSGAWDVTNVKHNHPEKTGHPAQFPEGIVSPFIDLLTRPGDHILDPFAGSGTVGAAAAKLGRRATLIDAEPRYCEIARERCAAVTQQGVLNLGSAA